MQRDWLEDLLRHLGWADACVWRAVLACDAARDDARLLFWLHHIHTVQHAFLRIWRSEELELPELAHFPDRPSLARWGRTAHQEIVAFLGTADEATLAAELRVPWTERLEETWEKPIEHPSLAHSAVQVAMHSAHHRGQAAARLREVGGEPPLVDFIAWLWWGRPEPDWSFLEAAPSG